MRGVKIIGIAVVATVGLIVACRDATNPLLAANGCTPIIVVPPVTSTTLSVLGQGPISKRYTAEVDARGAVAYTTTWGGITRVAGIPGNAIYVWSVSGAVPVLVDSVIVSGATTVGDVAISDDGKLLVVATERTGGSIVVYDITTPASPVQLSRFTNSETNPGVHTAEIGRVNGKLYAFLAINPGPGPAKLVIVDLSTPSAPQQVYSKVVGRPYVHDVFVRDGLLFLANWNDGMEVWDLGGAGNGSPSSPRVISSVVTVNGEAHNIWWFHDPVSGSKAYAFVGEEGPAVIGSTSVGDIHVIDVCDLANPREVAFFHVAGAGTHNFSMDESRGILYAAFYNGGVRAIDVRGDLGKCSVAQQSSDGRCDLGAMGREVAAGLKDQTGRYVWGVANRSGALYASDMINGLWTLKAIGAP